MVLLYATLALRHITVIVPNRVAISFDFRSQRVPTDGHAEKIGAGTRVMRLMSLFERFLRELPAKADPFRAT